MPNRLTGTLDSRIKGSLIKLITLSIVIFALSSQGCKRGPDRITFGGSTVGSDDTNNPSSPDGSAQTNEVNTPTALTFTTAFPRITALQWENSVRDILLLDTTPNLSAQFPGDPQNTLFANDGNSLIVSDPLWQSYVQAAEKISDSLAANAAQMAKLIPASAANLTGDAKAKTIITPLATRAFRRPPTDAQMSRLLVQFNKGTALTGNTNAVNAGIQAVVYLLLQSPYFLYRVELGTGASALTTLNAWEVASRISFAAWNTIPDAELIASARSGELLTEAVLAKQVKRVMADPKANPVLLQFYTTIFGTSTYADVIKKDPSIVKSWPADMGKTLVQESELFINEVVVKNKGGINQLLTADYAFVNSQTAPLYKVPAPAGSGFVKTTLDTNERIGILTQIGFLARRSGEKESNAIRRGVLVSDKLLCADVTTNAPTPPKVDPPGANQTSRDVINKISGPGTCGAGCHAQYINPSGYAFENFDAAGNFRTTDNGHPVNAAATLTLKTGPVDYKGPHDFVEKLKSSSDLHTCLVKKAVGLLYARLVDTEDETLIAYLAEQSAADVSTRDMFATILMDSRIKLRGNKGK
ncbi:MAG: DUF1592 domain-containing protein [Chitinophagaceae bacterium]|nr:DUF1592 domain-containing protein [Oligoflexus sp.]